VAWNARRGGSIELPHCVMVELACGTNMLHVLATLRDRYKGSSRKGSLAVKTCTSTERHPLLHPFQEPV
jgi:hypothetical protein